MASYTPPQVLIKTAIEAESASNLPDLKTCIIGPKYRIIENDSLDGSVGNYNAYQTPNEYTLPTQNPENIDNNSFNVVLRDAYARIFKDDLGEDETITATYYKSLSLWGGSAKIKNAIYSANIAWKANGTSYPRHSKLYSRDVQVGDKVLIRAQTGSEIEEVWSRVIGFLANKVNGAIGTAYAASTNVQDTSVSSSSNVTASYTVTKIGFPTSSVNLTLVNLSGIKLDTCYHDAVAQDTYLIECTHGGDITSAVFRVVSASGKDDTSGFALSAWGSLKELGNRGIQIGFTRTAPDIFVAGMAWELEVVFGTQTAVPTSSGTYTGTVDTTYIIEVVRGGKIGSDNSPIITVRTSNGIDSDNFITVDALDIGIPIGSYGVTLVFSGYDKDVSGLYTGDQFLIECTAAKGGAYNTLVLADDLPESFLGTEVDDVDLGVFIYKTKVINLDANDYTRDGELLTLDDNIITYDNDIYNDSKELVPLSVDYASVYVGFRELVSFNDTGFGSISSIAAIESALGTVDPRNEVAYGVYLALLNSNGQPVYYKLINSNNLSGYTESLSELEKHDDTYNLVPMSNDAQILALFKAHCASMSTPENGRWRRVFGAIPYQTVVPVISGDGHEAIVSQDPETSEIAYVIVTAPSEFFITNGVKAGDIFRFAYSGETYKTAVIESVLSEATLRLVSNTTPVPVLAKFEIWRNLTETEATNYFITKHNEVSGSSELFIDVFVKSAKLLSGESAASYYVAAAVAGLRSGIYPNQPLTSLPITGFKNVETLSPTQMNTLAENGVLIVYGQLDGSVVIRHGLTSNMSAIEYREESIMSNIDTLRYTFLNLLTPFRGQMLMTNDALEALRTLLINKISQLKSDYTLNVYIKGLLADGEVVTLEPHPVIKDRLVGKINVTLPMIANTLDITLYI